MGLASVCASPLEVLPGPCTFPRPAKSPGSLRQWLVSQGRHIAPQYGKCLLTLESHPESAIQCTRLLPLDIQHHEATCLEWSWGLAPSTLDIDSDPNLLILTATMCKAFVANNWALFPNRQTVKNLYDFYSEHKDDPEQPPSILQLYEGSDRFEYTLVPLESMEATHLHRADNHTPGAKTYTRFQYPFSGFPLVRSHVHPHLVIFNLCDKLKDDIGASVHLVMLHPDPDIRATAVDMLDLYKMWLGAHPRRAAGFYANKLDAISPRFCFEDIDYSEDVVSWDAPRARTRKPTPKPRFEDYLAYADQSDDESLDSLDSGNIEQVDWWLCPSAVDKLWLEGMRQWQASSATGDYEYHAPWEETSARSVSEDDDAVFEYFNGYTSD